ncbi:tyrosine--tRNA ligase [Patescibacteria group bacterium]|nr:tyrosine--tRNA ligase [Patescibacteria group bacterium]
MGNPSGKDNERPVLTTEQLAHNQEGIHQQFTHLTRRCEEMLGQKFSFEIVNNYDWFKDFSFLDFLREVGRTITVNRMMGKDIVRRRITEADQSISFAEFSYMLIMGYDFCHLAEKYNVELELGGSDERDGIMAGLEITHKKLGKKVYGVTNKLVLDSNGKKFGKSE